MLNPEYSEIDSIREVDFGEPNEQNLEEACFYAFPHESFAREDNFLWRPLKGMSLVDSRKLIAICGLLRVAGRVVGERIDFVLSEFCLREDLLKIGELLEIAGQKGEVLEWVTPQFNELTEGRWQGVVDASQTGVSSKYSVYLKAFKAQKITLPSDENLPELIRKSLNGEDLLTLKRALCDFNFDKLI